MLHLAEAQLALRELDPKALKGVALAAELALLRPAAATHFRGGLRHTQGNPDVSMSCRTMWPHRSGSAGTMLAPPTAPTAALRVGSGVPRAACRTVPLLPPTLLKDCRSDDLSDARFSSSPCVRTLLQYLSRRASSKDSTYLVHPRLSATARSTRTEWG